MKRFAIRVRVSRCRPRRSVASRPADTPKSPPPPTVQIAILLDTSNSMDGLIAQAKTQLWNVVNEFVKAKKDGRPPAIQVALFEYGKQTLSPERGLRPADPSADRRPRQRLRGAVRPQDQRRRGILRLGDPRGRQPARVEPVRRRLQGDLHRRQRAVHARGRRFPRLVPRRHRARDRRQHDLLRAERRGRGRPAGRTARSLADGRYMSIDQNQKVVEIPTPQDAEIARLGVELNKTYLPYGKMGEAGQARQAAQDANAVAASPSCPGQPVGLQGERRLLQRRLGPRRRDQERQVQARRPQGRRPPRRLPEARQGGPEGEGGRGGQAARGDPGQDPQR